MDEWEYSCSRRTAAPGPDCETRTVDNTGTVSATAEGTTVTASDTISTILLCPDQPTPRRRFPWIHQVPSRLSRPMFPGRSGLRGRGRPRPVSPAGTPPVTLSRIVEVCARPAAGPRFTG